MGQRLVDSGTYSFSGNTRTLWGVGIFLKVEVLISREGKEYEFCFKFVVGWTSRRWDVGMWTGLGWHRIGTGGGRL